MGKPCVTCAERRRRLAEQLAARQLADAAKTAIEGVGMVLGLVKKEETNGDEEH